MEGIVNISIDPTLVNIAHPTWDTFIVIFFAVAVILYSFFASRERLAVVLLSVYSALAIVGWTPVIRDYLAGLGGDTAIYYRLAVFIGTFLVLFLLFSFNMSLRADIGQTWPQALLLSFFQVGLLISAILSFIPQEYFSTQFSEAFFSDDMPRSFWMVAPIVAMVVMRNKQPSGGGK